MISFSTYYYNYYYTLRTKIIRPRGFIVYYFTFFLISSLNSLRTIRQHHTCQVSHNLNTAPFNFVLFKFLIIQKNIIRLSMLLLCICIISWDFSNSTAVNKSRKIYQNIVLRVLLLHWRRHDLYRISIFLSSQ